MAEDDTKQDAAEEPREDEFGIDQKRMPFTAHLVELRWRILICVVVLAVFFLVFFVGFSERLFGWMTLPIRKAFFATGGEAKYHFKYEEMLLALTPMAMFVSAAYFCLVGALAVVAPVLVYELWAFVAPGLKRKERMVVTKIVASGSLLFFVGGAFAYFVALPVMLGFFLEYTAGFGVTSRWNIADVIDFETMIILVFGVCFEMPLVVVALAFVGILPPHLLAKKRRHAIVIIFIVAGVITPTPDPFSQICLAVPLIVLYEIGYQFAKRIKKKGTLWDRIYGPAYNPDDETPSDASAYTPPADLAPHDSTYPAYTEGSAYSPDAYAQPEGPQPTGTLPEGEGAQPTPLPAPAETPQTGSETPGGGPEPAAPEQPVHPEPPKEPQMGTEVEDQRSTHDEGQKPQGTEEDPNVEPMH